jgi:hypothetical protein
MGGSGSEVIDIMDANAEKYQHITTINYLFGCTVTSDMYNEVKHDRRQGG